MAHNDLFIYLNLITWTFFFFLFLYIIFNIYFLPVFFKCVRIRKLFLLFLRNLFFINFLKIIKDYLFLKLKKFK